MSFNVEFVAESASDAKQIVAEEHLPDSIKMFLERALMAFPQGAVSVKAVGHLYTTSNDYSISSALIEVKWAAKFRKPKSPT